MMDQAHARDQNLHVINSHQISAQVRNDGDAETTVPSPWEAAR